MSNASPDPTPNPQAARVEEQEVVSTDGRLTRIRGGSGFLYFHDGRPYICAYRCESCSEFGVFADTKMCPDCEAEAARTREQIEEPLRAEIIRLSDQVRRLEEERESLRRAIESDLVQFVNPVMAWGPDQHFKEPIPMRYSRLPCAALELYRQHIRGVLAEADAAAVAPAVPLARRAGE